MRRRVLLIAAALLLAIFFVPQLPPVRSALLGWAVSLAAQNGYTVLFERSAGNPWYTLEFHGVRASGPGVDASAETLRLGYTLPALITGTLPLRAEVHGVRGDLDVGALGPAPMPDDESPPGAGERAGIRPLLRRLELSDVALEVQGLPFDLPPVQLNTLEAEGQGDTFTFDAALAADGAVAEVSGTATLEPLNLDMTVARADVALAESFFEGARGGTLSGAVRVNEGGVTADLELQEGEVEIVGLGLSEVAGPVRVRDRLLETELSGRALGGPLTGSGTVDFGAQRWRTEVSGNAQLAEAIVWAGMGRLSPEFVETALEPEGDAEVTLTMVGWQTFSLEGEARGAGELLGEPLTDLEVDFGFDSDTGVFTDLEARLGGAPLSFALTPEGEGFDIQAEGRELPLRGFTGDLEVDLSAQDGRLTGTTDLNLGGEALGRAVTLDAAAITNGEAWAVDLAGEDALGARLRGEVELRSGEVEGAVRVRALELPGLEAPVNVTLLADGPLSELPLTLRVAGPAGVRPAAGGVRASADFSGEATARLAEGTLASLRGEFGPLTLEGSLNDLAYALEPTTLQGRARGEVALAEGRLTRTAAGLETSATLATSALRSAGVTLPDLNADLDVSLDPAADSATDSGADSGSDPDRDADAPPAASAALTARLRDEGAGIDLQVQEGTLRGVLDGTPLAAFGDAFAVTGETSAELADLSETLSLDVTARSRGEGPATTLAAVGSGPRAELSLQGEAGATLGGQTLAEALELSGTASLTGRSADLAGTLGDVAVTLSAAPGADGRVQARTGLGAGADAFEAEFSSLQQWRTDGTLPLAELGEALGLPLKGTLQSTLARSGAQFSGAATLQGMVFGVPLNAEATAAENALEVTGRASLPGRPLTLSGQALPEADLEVALADLGTLTLSGPPTALSLTGSGVLPAANRAGLSVAAQLWTLTGNLDAGDLGAGEVTLKVGDSSVRAVQGDAGWRLNAQLEQRARWRDTPLLLDAAVTRGPQTPRGRVQGTLEIGGSPLKIAGRFDDLSVRGALSAAALQPGLLGQIELDLQADALARSYDASASWRRPGGAQALTLRARGTSGDLTATLEGSGLDARFSTTGDAPTWRVAAQNVALADLPLAALQNLSTQHRDTQLHGTLTRGAQGGFGGRLQLETDLGSAQLRGTGDALVLDARSEVGQLRAVGPLFPNLNVALVAGAGDAAELSGRLSGTLARPQLRATVEVAAQNLGNGTLTLPAREVTLEASLADGLSATLSGEGVALRLEDGRWAGPLELPFTLQGEAHALSGTVQGPLAAPVLAAEVRGRTLQGPLTLSRTGLDGALTVSPKLEALPDAQLGARVRAAPDLSWRLELQGDATLPYRELNTTLAGEVIGQRARYSGAATLRVGDGAAGETVPLSFAGEGSRVQARAAFPELALSPFVPAQGTLAGEARFDSTNGATRFFANLRARGEAAGRPFDLTFSADQPTGLALSGTVAGAQLSLTGALPLTTLELSVADSALPLDARATLTLGETLALVGSGGLHGEALAVSGAYTPAAGSGELRLELGDAVLGASTAPSEGAQALTATLTAPNGVLDAATPIEAALRLERSEGALELTGLEAQVGDATLNLAGTVQPAALTGTLNVPAAGEPIALRLTTLETGYLAALTQNTLELRGVLTPGFIPERARLIGTLARPNLEVASDLVWQDGAGFSGRTDLTLTPREGAAVTLSLLGETGLRVRGAAHYREVPLATLAAQLSRAPWRERGVRGTLTLDAPAHELLPTWPGDPLTLRGALDLTGTLTDPQLAGPLELGGAVSATGQLRAARSGARLTLSGPGLRSAATVDASGVQGTLSLSAFDLAGLLGEQAPQLAEPTLSGALRATQRWGEAPQVTLSEVRFSGGQSTVQGRARLSDTPSAALELELQLSDFSPALRGRLSGPLTVSPQGPLGGTLRLRDLGPAAADWTLGGRLELAGSVANPRAALALAGRGAATGSLSATLAPRRGTFRLVSDLTIAGTTTDPETNPTTDLVTDLTLTRTRLGVSAAGSVAYGDFGAVLRTQGTEVQLFGDGRLAGWRGLYTPERLSVQGSLASLNPQLGGTLALTGAPSERLVSGSLNDLALGTVSFGDLTLSNAAVDGAPGLSLEGEALGAEVGLAGSLPWRVSRLSLALPGGAQLTAGGAGTRTQGTLTGNLQGAGLDLPAQADYAAGGLALSASGALPVGALALDARLVDGRWRGGATITEAGGRVLESSLSGALSTPVLAGRLNLGGDSSDDRAAAAAETTVQGTFSVGRESARLEARVQTPGLSEPLILNAAGWPLALTATNSKGALAAELRDGRLISSGRLELDAGPALVTLLGDTAGTAVRLDVPAAPGLALSTTLPGELSAFAALLDGVSFQGEERTSGSLTLGVRPNPQLSAAGLRWRAPTGTLELSGEFTLGEPRSGTLDGHWRGHADAALPWLRRADVPFRVALTGTQLSATTAGALGEAEAHFDTAARRFTLLSDLTLGQGQVVADVAYTPAAGPSGTVDLASLPVFTFGGRVATLSSLLELTPVGVAGRGELQLAGGAASLSGDAGWARLLPPALHPLTPAGGDALSAQVRLDRFELGGVPQVAARLPYLEAPVSGVATISENQIVGQLVAPGLQVLNTALPTQLEFNGTLSALEARASVADSRLNLSFSLGADGPNLSGLVTLEGFPLQTLAEAVVGESQVAASATGAARFDIPINNPRAGYVRLATERLTLRNTAPGIASGSPAGAAPGRRGETTRGEVALRFENGSLFVERAEFSGVGFWTARGILTPDELDFTLEAQDADFTPLLSLVPQLAAFSVGAQGSLDMRASGSVAAPDITLESPSLEVSVAGSRYRALDTAASLSGGAFGLRGDIVGVAPIEGQLELRGNGQVNLAPFVTSGLALRFDGAATIPTVGEVTDIHGRIFPAETGWQLEGTGVLGEPLSVSGRLAPLDLTLTGRGLDIGARRLFVASSVTDLDLTVRAEAGGFDVAGNALVRQAQLSLDRSGTGEATGEDTGEAEDREGDGADDGTDAPLDGPAPDEFETGAGATAMTEPEASGAAVEAPAAAPQPGGPETAVATIGSVVRQITNPAFARVRFDDVRLVAPQEVIFQEAFGNAELSLDLTLSGTAAEPRLDGEARTLRGSLRFSGQEFTLTQGVATFDPAQGAFPTLSIEAQASFDKARSLGALRERYSFVEPSGPTFDTQLSITGGFEEGLGGRRALNLEPTLSSNALVQEDGAGVPRPLEEAELVSLLTLGRLQLDATITGTDSLAGTVAASALDTAVDLLLVSELQDALGEALGVDLLEIRTSALSTILNPGGETQDFGVSVRVGGYLNENLFASVQVGRYDDPEQNYALSNEFSLRYTAAPLELNLSGGVNFAQTTLSAVTDFALALSYAVTPLISLDASLETTALGQQTSVGFGVSFTW